MAVVPLATMSWCQADATMAMRGCFVPLELHGLEGLSDAKDGDEGAAV